MKKQKYNPDGAKIWKGKQIYAVGYKKVTEVTELEKIADIILNGGVVDIMKQEILDNGAHTMTIKIYFIPCTAENI